MQTSPVTRKQGLYHASEINWSDPTIHRAGITPIFTKGLDRYIGLGVTNSTAVIVTIGGAYEAKDRDLLVTAVREYNEETGSSIQELDVVDCYVLINKGSVNILFPVPDRVEFNPNEELERILWLTTSQATIISRNQSYQYQTLHNTVRILTMSRSLLNEIPWLVRAVDSNIPFIRLVRPFLFTRVYKAPEVKQARVSTNFNQLLADIADPSLFYGSASLVARDGYVSFERRDKSIYAFTSDDFNKLIDIIRANKIKVYVGFESEVETYSKLLDRQHITSIESRIKKFSHSEADKNSLQRIWDNFQSKIKFYRTLPAVYSVTWETVLIHETEEAIYRVTQNIPYANNNMRSSFLESLDLTNLYVSSITAIGSNVMFWELEDFLLERQQLKVIRPYFWINVMLKLGLLSKDNDVISVV